MIIYFGCRIHGVSLMKWMKKISVQPESYAKLSKSNFKDFIKISNILSPNIDHFYPGLTEEGKKWLENNQDL